MKKKLIASLLLVILAVINIICVCFFLQEVAVQYVLGGGVIVTIVIALAKGLEINGMSDVLAVVLPESAPMFIHWFSDIPFINKVSEVYTSIAQIVCDAIGKDTMITISNEMGVAVTFTIALVVYEIRHYFKDQTAMKILRGSKDEGLQEKSFEEKSSMFCKTLQQWLEEINREANWNENLFTPLEAEVEVDNGGKKKKRYEDLLKCLKNNRRSGTVYLVLGPPGAGKSVSMRKLCLDLLKESEKTKKIPVYINLKEWNEDWNLDHMPEKKDLITFIRKSFEVKGDCLTEGFLNEYFERMLEDGRWYFIFDSFDEMPCLMGKRNCQELIDGISALLYQLMTGPNQSGGVVASRLYKSPSSAVGATITLKIQEFSDIKIKTMLKKYSNHFEEVTKRIFDGREDLVSLCRNPFYLALLIDYVTDKGLALPDNQMELYHNFIEGRLKKCADKLEREQMVAEDIYQAAKELASFMQQTPGCGLECPTKLLYQNGEEAYWRKVFEILKYAKICRFGGQDEAISFIHRRFQEFFLVENIIDQHQEIAYEKYCDILSDAGMRDALVLYCEVAEEAKAREIAGFCWKIIQSNIDQTNNIHKKESQELVCVLYFMKEAFRNRKQVLSDFEESFYHLVKRILESKETERRVFGLTRLLRKSSKIIKEESSDNDNEDKNYKGIDYVVLLAFVNSMIIFSKKQLESLVLEVFRINNRWLNDVIMQNCRILETLGYHMENKFVRYFGEMDIKIFFKRFSNIRFSLSISRKFRYVRNMHLITMLLNLAYVILSVFSGIATMVCCLRFIVQLDISRILQSFSLENILDKQVNMSYMLESLLILLVTMFCAFVCGLIVKRAADFFGYKVFWICLVSLFTINLYVLDYKLLKLTVLPGISLAVIFMIACFFITVHDIKHYIKDIRKMIELLKKELQPVAFILIILLPISILMMNRFIMIAFCVLSFAFIAVIFITMLRRMANQGLLYVRDCIWLGKQDCNLKHMQRIDLENNLDNIHFDSIRHKYLDLLLLHRVELEGVWQDGGRPEYSDDRVNHVLAKLDCMKLNACDYLF